MTKDFFYLVEVQYLGYRFHGWQKQPGLKTVHLMLEKTARFLLEEVAFKILVTGRTDAMVSANQTYFELFVEKELDIDSFVQAINFNLPADIRLLSMKAVDRHFNIIQDPKEKEYVYLFSYGKKNHPFAAPYICNIAEELDVELMQAGAKIFQGAHNFRCYCYKPTEHTIFEREIKLSEIVPNELLTANFFPEQSFLFRVRGKGFMRHQIRMMMGSLFCLGKGEIGLDDIQLSLSDPQYEPLIKIAPAAGLILNQVAFDR